MTDINEFERAARLLSTEQQREAMQNLVELAQDPEAGIMRQILSEPKKPLTDKQQYVFENHIVRSMVERSAEMNPATDLVCPGLSIAMIAQPGLAELAASR